MHVYLYVYIQHSLLLTRLLTIELTEFIAYTTSMITDEDPLRGLLIKLTANDQIFGGSN